MTNQSVDSGRREIALSVLAYLLVCAFLFARIWKGTQGHFTYTLDDPYIHLALAERIRHGLYGLNLGQYCSPSSSLLWPLLLAPFTGNRFTYLVPLVLNLLAGTGAAAFVGYLVQRVARPAQATLLRRVVLAVLLIVAFNLVGLTFTGMEQLLQVFLCLCCAVLFLDVLQGVETRWWTLLAAALLPSVRYEGVLVTLACALFLALSGKRRLGLALFAVAVLPLLLFGAFLVHHHLPALPISVLMKGESLATGFHEQIKHILYMATNGIKTIPRKPERWPVLALLVASAWLGFSGRSPRERQACALVAGVAALQLLFGPFGWFFRYELYCIAFVFPVVLASWIAREGPARISDPIVCAAGLLALVYLQPIAATPNAAESIHREQGAMAVFTHDFYTGNLAVIDLGMQAFQRDPSHYILDLAALGSPEIFQAMRTGNYTPEVVSLVQQHNIGLVIAPYENVGQPRGWKVVAQLCAQDVRYGPSSANVLFYATPYADEASLLNALTRFKSALWQGSELIFQSQAQAGCPKLQSAYYE